MVSQLTPNLEVQGSNPSLPSLYMYICIYIYIFIYLVTGRRFVECRRLSVPRQMPSDTGAAAECRRLTDRYWCRVPPSSHRRIPVPSPDAVGSPAPSSVRFWLAKTLYE